VCELYHEDHYIEVEGSFHRPNWVSLEVMDGLVAIHVSRQPLLPVSTDFQTWKTLVNRLRSIALKSRPEQTRSVAARPRGWAGRLALMPLWLVVWPHVVYMSQTFLWWYYLWWNSKSSCNFLKCSNLAPMFLKSNRHQNHGTRLVDKVNTWLFHTFTRYIGAWK
jgi:hypothetical protein